MKNLTTFFISSLFFSTFSFATTINVPADYSTIQAGINATTNGDTVLVQPGTYMENINFNGKNIVVGSLFLTTGDTTHISRTIIDDNQNESVVIFESGEDLCTILCGFTITNGYSYQGGGIKCNGSSPCICYNIISANQALQGGGIKCGTSNSRIEYNRISGNSNWVGQISAGGGIYVWESDLIISENKFANNTSDRHGGAIHLERSTSLIVNNIITGNSSGFIGGGICCYVASSGNIVNNLINNNTASIGGGIYLNEVPFQIVNNTICFNSATDGGGIMCINNALMDVVNTILWDNTAGGSGNQIFLSSCHADFHYCDIQEGEVGFYIGDDVTYTYENNLETDPLFLNTGEHPYSLSPGSECINAGIPDTSGLNLPENDLAGNSRIIGDRIDIGGYEWQEVVGVRDKAQLPKKLSLSQNYPNPFKGVTRICYKLPDQSNVSLVIYDMFGKVVRQLVNATQDAGYKSVQWDATDNTGRTVGAGTYIYQIQVGEYVQTKRMVILK